MQPPNWPPGGPPPQAYPQQPEQQGPGPQGQQPQGYGPQGQQPQGYGPQGQQPQGYGPQGQPPQGYGYAQQGFPQQGAPVAPPKKKGSGAIVAIGIVVLLAAIGGGGYYVWRYNDRLERKATLAGLCSSTSADLAKPSQDPDTFMLQLSNALESCSAACELEDDSSCSRFDKHLDTICGVDPSICAKLCKSLTVERTKQSACDHKDGASSSKKKKSG
jgi:hypothetical protein